MTKNEYSYYSIDDVLDKTRTKYNSESTLAVATFELDYKYDFIERRVYTFIDMLGRVGGLMGALIPLRAVFSSILSTKIFTMTLLSQFYQVKKADGPEEILPKSVEFFYFTRSCWVGICRLPNKSIFSHSDLARKPRQEEVKAKFVWTGTLQRKVKSEWINPPTASKISMSVGLERSSRRLSSEWPPGTGTFLDGSMSFTLLSADQPSGKPVYFFTDRECRCSKLKTRYLISN